MNRRPAATNHKPIDSQTPTARDVANPLSRRRFLGAAAATSATAIMVHSQIAAGADQTPSANETIRIAAIGTGGKGRHNIGQFLAEPDAAVVAVCDVDAGHLQEAAAMVNKASGQGGKEGVFTATDYRRLLDRPDVDAVVVSTPDHWHALASIHALQAGKDVYCEKPLANSVGEGRAMVAAVAAYDRVLQCGSHERSNPRVRFACEQVRAGALGKIYEVRVNMPTDQGHHEKVASYGPAPDPTRPPANLDYNRWLGPAPWVPHVSERVHFWWRFVLAYGGGEMTDRGAHIIDIAQLALDRDHTVPVRYMAIGNRADSTLYDAFMDYVFVNEYEDGLRIVGVDAGPRGVEFVGDRGSLMVHVHGGKLDVTPSNLIDTSDENIADGPLGRTPSHHRNFLNSVKSREQPFASAEAGHRTATICHLNNIAMRLGRPLTFDPQTETIKNDAEANEYLMPEMRKEFSL